MQFKWEIYYLFCCSNNLKKLNDYLLKIKTEKVQLLDYKKIDELYLKGYEQTKNKIKEIKKHIKLKDRNVLWIDE